PSQPHILISIWNVNKWLLGALLLFILETVFYYVCLREAVRFRETWMIGFWGWSLMFSFVHIFLVGMDAWSRFQNYKRIKDLLFEHGFSTRIAHQYSGSLCQRMAVRTAAKELGMEAPLIQYYHSLGIRWYHIVPYFMIRDPLFMFKRYFWARTFLEP